MYFNFDFTFSSHKWEFLYQTSVLCDIKKIPFPYRIVQAFVGITVGYKSLYFCFNFPDFLMFSFWWEKNSVAYSNMHRYKAWLFAASLGFSQLSLAFCYQAWLFTSSKHAWPKNKSTAEKQTDSLILLAKQNWPFEFAFTKRNDMCCTLLPNVGH